MTRTPDNNCCKDWLNAQEDGTDNEMYLALLRNSPRDNTFVTEPYKPDQWHIGSGLPPIQFCPWCGSKVQDG